MKCKKLGLDICMCADCVYNPNYCVNTPMPCLICDCDWCELDNVDCYDIFCFECSGHLTINEVNQMLAERGE